MFFLILLVIVGIVLVIKFWDEIVDFFCKCLCVCLIIAVTVILVRLIVLNFDDVKNILLIVGKTISENYLYIMGAIFFCTGIIFIILFRKSIIENIFAPPKVRTIKLKIRKIIVQIKNITEKVNKINKIISLLNKNRDSETNDILKKNENIANYLNDYFDKYLSSYYNLNYKVKKYFFLKKNLHENNIDKYIERLEIDINKTREVCNNMRKEVNGYYKYECKEYERTISDITEDIKKTRTGLLIKQSSNALAGISPIDDNYNYDKYNLDIEYENTLKFSDELNVQYEQFIVEIDSVYLTSKRSPPSQTVR